MLNGKIDIVNKRIFIVFYLMHTISRLDSYHLIVHVSKELSCHAMIAQLCDKKKLNLKSI